MYNFQLTLPVIISEMYILLLLMPILLFIGLISIFAVIIIRRKVLDSKFSKTLQDINENSQYKKKNPKGHKGDDFLSKDQKKEYIQLQKIQHEGQDIDIEESEKIVGFVEPKGFWTKLIMSEKIGYMLQAFNAKKTGKGFWRSLISAQAQSQGKSQGRGR